MAAKIDFLYPFDKGFFGKTMRNSTPFETAKQTAYKKVMPDTLSDFMRHFEMKMKQQTFERVPQKDTYEPLPLPKMFPDMVP